MTYIPHIRHRRSIRLKGYDYSQAGLYFVTICVQNRECLFGKIAIGVMQLNGMGQTVEKEWIKSAEIRKEINMHEYIIMPNHFHAIVEIIANNTNDGACADENCANNAAGTNNGVPAVGAYGIRPNEKCVNDKYCTNNKIGANIEQGVCHTPLRSPSKTLGALIRGFKSSVTKQLGFSPWQRNYHEHIIRNETSYQHIAGYIVNNPMQWANDKFYTE